MFWLLVGACAAIVVHAAAQLAAARHLGYSWRVVYGGGQNPRRLRRAGALFAGYIGNCVACAFMTAISPALMLLGFLQITFGLYLLVIDFMLFLLPRARPGA